MAHIRLKRVYDKPAPTDGVRVLVDRLWPRGLKRDEARIDHWLKDIAPSTTLRQWFNHDLARWDGFSDRYRLELQHNPAPLAELRMLARRARTLTLLFAAKDAEHNNAVVLKALLD